MITSDERWKLFVLFQTAMQKAEEKGKVWTRIDRPGSMEACHDSREELMTSITAFREYLDTLVDPASKQAAHDKVANVFAAFHPKT